jgi:hypothetical protein
VDAARWQGVPTTEYREYSEEAQRSQGAAATYWRVGVSVAQAPSGYADEFGFHGPLPTTDGPRIIPAEGFPTGPEIGEVLPDFTLPSADGRTIRLHEARDGSKAAVMFFRSAVW